MSTALVSELSSCAHVCTRHQVLEELNIAYGYLSSACTASKHNYMLVTKHNGGLQAAYQAYS